MKRFLCFLLSFIACLCVWVSPATAQNVLPEVAEGLEAQMLELSFDDLPAFESDGFMLGYRDTIFQVEGQAGLDRFDQNTEGYQLPYDPAREWIAGQFPSEVIKLGDLLFTGAGIEQLTMDTIGQMTGIDIENFQIADVPFLQDFTLSDLVGDVPFLGDYSLVDLPNLANKIGGAGSEDLLSQYLLNNPDIAQLPVGGDLLESLRVADIPNLGATQLGDMPEIGDDVVTNVPGLSLLQFDEYPGLEMIGNLIPLAKQDIAFGETEYSGEEGKAEATPKPVSGGTNGKEIWEPIACVGGCPHLELYDSDMAPVKGAWAGGNWMTNKHRVKDGFGILGALFNEAGAYRLPFGDTFAFQVRSTDEATGAAEWGIAFRVCKRGFPDLGCTAYFMEVPLPITTYEGATILTGIKDGRGGSTQPIKAPDGWEELRPDLPPQLRGLVGANNSRPAGGLCGEGPGGVSYEALAKAYKTIESNIDDYDSIGRYANGGKGGNGQTLRGRGLGKYQYMTYREEVRAIISAEEGGAEFLAKADRGDDLSVSEMKRLFPSEAQDRLFKEDQKNLIQQAMKEGFEGDALIGRVGELHTGGKGARPGEYEGYARELSVAYKEKLEDSDCGKATGNFINPNPNGIFTSGFGRRWGKMHGGVDLASPNGLPGASILATDGGTVIRAGWNGGYGNYVEIDHGGGTKSWYGHLIAITVKAGDPVKQGDEVGKEGTTGRSTGVHLHFGLEVNGQLVDPAAYIPI